MLAHLKWVDIGIYMPNTAISEGIIGFVEVTDGDIQTSLVLWKFCSFLCQCFYMEGNENWTIRGGFDSRRNPARCSTRLREISFYLCSRCKIKGMLQNTEKNHYFQRKYVEGISVDLSAPAWVLSEGIQGKVRWLRWEDFEYIFKLFTICVMMMMTIYILWCSVTKNEHFLKRPVCQGGFMVFGWFPWFFKVVSWFFMVFGWFP